MTNRQDFILSADASQVERVTKQLDAMLARIIQSAAKVSAATDKMGDSTGGLKKLQVEAIHTGNGFMQMARLAEISAARINAAFRTVNIPGMRGGMPAGPGQTNYTPAWVRQSPKPPAKPPSLKPYAAARARSLENVPLFGGHSGLEQGQQVQNAVTGLLPIAGMIAVWGKGVKDAIEKAQAGTVMNRLAGNAGASGMSRMAGNDYAAPLVMFGEKDSRRVSKQSGLAADIEAAGGSGAAFIEALTKKGPEAAKAMAEVAESMGIHVSETATLNQMLAQLNEKFGGLHNEVEQAAGSWPPLFNAITENLSMFGEAISKSSSIDGLTALLQGDTEKAKFIYGQDDLDDSPAEAAIKRGIVSAIPGVGLAMSAIGDKMLPEMSVYDAENKVTDRLGTSLKSGKINQAMYGRALQSMQSAKAAGDYSTLYDMSEGKGLPTSVDAGDKGNAVAPPDKKKKKKPFQGPRAGGGDFRIVVSADRNSPSPMSVRGY